MKGCLKSPMPSPGLECGQTRKSVAFGAEGSEEVYLADVWDRTPMEPARRLSYQDLIELKEIQRSLPRANQLADPISGRPGSHYLSAVPIGLLPLLPNTNSGGSQESPTSTSPITSPPSTPSGATSHNWLSPSFQRREHSAPQPWHPPHLSHLLPGKPATQRQKPKFEFLPLLDTSPTPNPQSPCPSNPSSRSPSPDLPSDTDHSQDPPTPSLTNASVDSSPLSRASSVSPEPPLFQLPPLRRTSYHSHSAELYNKSKSREHDDPYFATHSDDQVYHSRTSDSGATYGLSSAVSAMRLEAVASPTLLPPSPLVLDATAQQGRDKRHPKSSDQANVLGSAKPIRRRNFMVVNGVEIEIDDDDDDDDADIPPERPVAAPKASSPYAYSGPILESPSEPAPIPIPTARVSCMPARDRAPGLTSESPSSSAPRSPTLTASPNRCTKSLFSPVRYQSTRGTKAAAI